MFRNYCNSQYLGQVSEKALAGNVLLHALVTTLVGILQTNFIHLLAMTLLKTSRAFNQLHSRHYSRKETA